MIGAFGGSGDFAGYVPDVPLIVAPQNVRLTGLSACAPPYLRAYQLRRALGAVLVGLGAGAWLGWVLLKLCLLL